jgi:hypothetical protein
VFDDDILDKVTIYVFYLVMMYKIE